ncbi:S-layer homology domain-containing protein [Paenibacillus sp. GCM10027627]|uniref:S-layer homology domain-containing protein n=1 Tax=unclassified Paenibacillus TaxID=185978 RepID=UPI003636CF19
MKEEQTVREADNVKMKNRLVHIGLAILLIVGGMPASLLGFGGHTAANGATFSGSGTSADPYLIETAEQFNAIRGSYLGQNLYFKLNSSIDLSSYAEGAGWEPIGTNTNFFEGHLDGNGFEISGLKVDRGNHTGLFASIGMRATVQNVRLTGVHVKGDYYVGALTAVNYGNVINSSVSGIVSGNFSVGGLIGAQYGEVRNSYSFVKVRGIEYIGVLAGNNSGKVYSSYASGEAEGKNAGGLVGYNSYGDIHDSHSASKVSGSTQVGGLVGTNNNGIINGSYSSGEVRASTYVGGLAGLNSYATIQNSYSSAKVFGNHIVGGLVGLLTDSSIIENSYASGSLRMKDYVSIWGGLIGDNYSPGSAVVTNSFYDTEATEQSVSDGGTGKTTEEMQNLATYDDGGLGAWDFTTIWGIDPAYNGGYPYLRGAQAFISYDGNGHAGGSVPGLQSFVPGTAAAIHSGTHGFVKAAALFDGWNTAADGSGSSYRPGDFAAFPAHATLYVKWLPASAAATIASSIGVVSAGGTANESLTKVTIGTSVAELKAAITPAAGATFDIYEADGVTAATEVENGKLVVVTAQDLIAKTTYTVSVASGAKELIDYSIPEQVQAAVIDRAARTVTVTVPYGTELGQLVASFTVSPDAAAKVGTTAQISGTTANDFTNPIVWTVEAADGSVQSWTVTVTVAPNQEATLRSSIGTVSTGGTANETIVSIPSGTTLAALKAAITPAEEATFEVYDADGTTVATTLATGKKVIVTAQDGTTKVTYTVTVNAAPPVVIPPPGVVRSTNGKLSIPAGSSGEVSLDDRIFVSIPVQTAKAPFQLTIERVTAPERLLAEDDALLSGVYELLKSFQANFQPAVSITLTFDPAKLENTETAAVFYYDEAEKRWIEVKGGIISGNRIAIKVDHFTKFAVFAASKDETGQQPEWSDIAGHWAEASIHQAVKDGIASGYPDGTFRPDRDVTRSEFTVLLMNALNKHNGAAEAANTELPFADSAKIGAWAKGAVAQALQAGYISGYGDGTFRPNDVITRTEMAVMVAKAFGPSPIASASTGFSDDGDIPSWARDEVAAIREAGILQGKEGNRFHPHASATRAEAVSILLRAAVEK